METLADGRKRIRITIEIPSGKKRKAFVAKTKKEVIKRRDEFLKKHSRATYDTEMTVAEYLHRWMEDGVKQNRRPTTVKEYESACRVHITPAIGDVKLQSLKAAHVQRLLADMRREGYAQSTCKRIYAIFGAAMSQAVKWQLLAASPMQGVEAPKVPTRSTRMALTGEQALRLLDAAKNWRGGRLHTIFVVAIATGMRQGEALGLTWDDVDLKRQAITIRRTLHREKGGWRFGPPKGGTPRTIDIDGRLSEILKVHRKRQLEERVAAEEWSREGEGMVFRGLAGKPVHRAVLLQSFHRLCEREGLPRITFHELRHTCATLLGQQNQHPQAVQRLLGHADIKTTLGIYSHVWPGQGKEAATALGDVLFPVGEAEQKSKDNGA